jgi:hypothetical protein
MVSVTVVLAVPHVLVPEWVSTVGVLVIWPVQLADLVPSIWQEAVACLLRFKYG